MQKRSGSTAPNAERRCLLLNTVSDCPPVRQSASPPHPPIATTPAACTDCATCSQRKLAALLTTRPFTSTHPTNHQPLPPHR
ncbi:hypothetical protein BST61_g2979 [Cercospora zeina]